MILKIFLLAILLPFYAISSFANEILEQKYYEVAELYLNNEYDKAHLQFLDLHARFINESKINFGIFSLIYAIDCLDNQKRYAEMIPLLNEANKIITENEDLKCNNGLQTDFNFLNASAHYNIGNPNLSLFYSNLALKFYEIGRTFSFNPDIIYAFNATSHLVIGDYVSAISTYQKLLNIGNTKLHDLYFVSKSQIGLSYYFLGDKLNSKLYFNICKESLASIILRDQSKSTYFSHLAHYFLEEQIIDSSRYYLTLIDKLDLDLHPMLNYYQNYGKLELKSNNFEKAESYFLKGINLCLDTFNYNKYKLAETYLLTSDAYNSVDKITKGLKYNKDCLETLIPDFKENTNNDPSISLNHRLTVEALLLKAELLSKNKEYGRAKIAIKQSQLYLDHMFHKKLLSQESRLFFVNKMKTDYESIIKIALDNNDPEFAFEVSQKIHGNLLSLELFKDEVAQRFNVPPEYTDYVQSLKVRISTKESNLSRINKTKESIKFDSLVSDLKYFKGELNNVLSSIEKKYPEYYELKYTSPEINSTKNIQNNDLSNNSALIEYFMGENNLYTFIVSKNNLKVLTSSIDSTLIDHVSSLNNSMRSLNSDFNTFTSSARYLYDSLLKEALLHLGPAVNKLYIIPDNEISYVPFEALIKDVPQSAVKSRYDLLPYVVNDYSISYHYSSVLLNSDNTSLTDNITGFAPSFTSNFSTEENLESLLHNKKEVLIIKDITDGQINIDTAANLRNLKASINTYRIAHLATHATCNDTLPFESKIYFEDGPLHAYEIYNMPHKLDLAVLSACETGTGALKKGEGLMSIARAFISSGCETVITSLWNVNDQKSVQIMQHFYTNLYRGEPVGKSLTHAKRKYLSNVNSVTDAHPYHWATFITIGNADMSMATFPWRLILIAISLLILLGLLYQTSKGKR